MTPGGTLLYQGEPELPPLVQQAVGLGLRLDFGYSCIPEHGRLLQILARGRAGGLIGETGTGCGVGLAWMVSATDASTRFVSVESDSARAAAVSDLVAAYPNVTILNADWVAIYEHAPFDLLYLDGGGKRGDDRADPLELLISGGAMVMDDFIPTKVGASNESDRDKLYWLAHPDLLATEILTTPETASIVAVRRWESGDVQSEDDEVAEAS